MNDNCRTLLVGFGSPHGDDQVGWAVADSVVTHDRLRSHVDVRKAAVPLDLLDWLEGVRRLHVCDAYHDPSLPGAMRRWEWTAETETSKPADMFREFVRLRCGGSHGFGLIETLDLAASLERLPRQIVVWGTAGSNFASGAPISTAIRQALPDIVDTIVNELDHARNVPGAFAAPAS